MWLAISSTRCFAQAQLKEDWIILSDGTKLAMDWYLPVDIPVDGFPVILEYLPYRKEEGRRNRYGLFSYFTDHGYLVARVDIRGTGNSDGHLIEYEYTDQEQADALEVIQSLADHPMCNGRVFMMGISWGGFNSLQVAMRKPKALQGIISMMSTDDLYEDDVHYMDGVMHIDAYEIGQDLANSLPGAPDFVIDSNYFTNRFDTKPWLLIYKEQQRDGPFWNRASLNEHYPDIDVPVLAIGGLYDGYRDFIARYFEHADVPVTAILGPWNHTFPNWAEPPPAIEWRDFAVEWMNCVQSTSCDLSQNYNQLYFYQRDWHRPGLTPEEIPGYWKEIRQWPPKHQQFDTLYLNNESELSTLKPSENSTNEISYKPSVGVEASGSVMWWGDWAPDQSIADQQSLLYRSDPLAENLEITGFPKVILQASCDTTQANWVVRLSDEAPDGRVTLITGAAFNATHRNSAENPEDIVSNKVMKLPIEMHLTSWTFRKGHRVRLAVNNAQWPMLWPTPYPMRTKIWLDTMGINQLQLPVLPGYKSEKTFNLPGIDPQLPGYRTIASETLSGYAEIRTSTYNHRTGGAEILATNSGEDAFPWGRIKYTEEIKHWTNDPDPAHTGVQSIYTITAVLPKRELRWEGHLIFTSDETDFHYHYTRKLFVNQVLIREKSWQQIIPRDHH
ncbi:MAG: CocE/NonD family hydrolase [Saprospiraceae bacterium]|nr:CocE/NonD family hydrolase [Saprospiraceae bacterium]